MISKNIFLAAAICVLSAACSTQPKQASSAQEASSQSHPVRSAANENPMTIGELLNPKITGENIATLKHYRVVIPNVLYRGGNSHGGNIPLKPEGFKELKKRNFSAATYMYTEGFDEKIHKKESFNQGVQYSTAAPSVRDPNAKSTVEFLTQLKDIIEQKKGPMYVHCWNGWHASGLMASIALMQFCNYTPEQAQDYWNANVPPRDKGIVKRMLKFKVIDELRISPEDASRICPR